jgi:serine/threonine protein kinase
MSLARVSHCALTQTFMPVAVKFLKEDADVDATRDFHSEINTIKALPSHPNVVSYVLDSIRLSVCLSVSLCVSIRLSVCLSVLFMHIASFPLLPTLSSSPLLPSSHPIALARFLGHCVRDKPELLVIEVCELGNLRDYVRSCRATRDKPQNLDLDTQMSFALQTAKGMSFLASHKIIHRDLAA